MAAILNPRSIESLLSRLHPTGELAPRLLARLARKARIVPLEPGFGISLAADRESLTYLVDGQIALDVDQADTGLIDAGSERALRPLFPEGCTRAFAVAHTECGLLRLDRELLDLLQVEQSAACAPAPRASLDDVGRDLVVRLEAAYTTGDLALPDLPDVAQAVQHAVQDDESGIHEIARIAAADTGLAERLIELANSPAYCGVTRVVNLTQAINRLGLDTTKNFTLAMAMHSLFQARSPTLREWSNQVYQHSANVAALSYVIALNLPGFDADKALLAGLAHDVGALPLLAFVDGREGSIQSHQLQCAFDELRTAFGAALLAKWQLPIDIQSVVQDSEDWMRDAAPEPDYSDVVVIAQLHSYVGDPVTARDFPSLDRVPALYKLVARGLDFSMGQDFLGAAAGKLTAVRRLLEI